MIWYDVAAVLASSYHQNTLRLNLHRVNDSTAENVTLAISLEFSGLNAMCAIEDSILVVNR